MFRILGALILAVPAVAAVGLLLAHVSIRAVAPELPAVEDVLAFARNASDLPVRLSILNTARQVMPRASVLEASLDPEPDTEYEMAFPAFALEWSDGRIFLIDLGMEASNAVEFGTPSERLLGAAPMEPLADVATRLGEARERVAGVAFTHLHTDHTNGALALCAADPAPIPWFATPLQAERSNYTTRPGRALVERAACLEPRPLEGGPIYAIPGFPGLGVFETGGHTPGSQVFVARVADPVGPRLWIFTGDLVNHIDGVRHNLPKPTLYSLFVVPEDRVRLDLLRRYLAKLVARPGGGLLVSHDLRQLEATGVPEW